MLCAIPTELFWLGLSDTVREGANIHLDLVRGTLLAFALFILRKTFSETENQMLLFCTKGNLQVNFVCYSNSKDFDAVRYVF